MHQYPRVFIFDRLHLGLFALPQDALLFSTLFITVLICKLKKLKRMQQAKDAHLRRAGYGGLSGYPDDSSKQRPAVMIRTDFCLNFVSILM